MSETDEVRDRIGYRLKRAQQVLGSAMASALGNLGITTAQFAVLSALEPGVPLSGADLARQCFVTPQTMNGVVAGLEKAGLVVRREHSQHGRIIETHLTDAGRSALREAHKEVLAIEGRMLAGMASSQRRDLADALRRCALNLGASSRSL